MIANTHIVKFMHYLLTCFTSLGTQTEISIALKGVPQMYPIIMSNFALPRFQISNEVPLVCGSCYPPLMASNTQGLGFLETFLAVVRKGMSILNLSCTSGLRTEAHFNYLSLCCV